jgi:2-polyprenyl-3-methyl-5-hydroxy-6-metoxy-1,4-benzoquinol methylase
VDLSDTNHVHTLSVLSVPAGARVLDLGGGGGPTVAKALSDRGCAVSLVADERTVRELRRHCAETLAADLDTVDLARAFEQPSFDTVLAMGTLQHVRSPVGLLRQAAAVLPPSGRLVATLPNVAHGAVRLELLRGRFRVPGQELPERTPLHVFDPSSAQDLFQEAGLSVVERLKVTRLLHETEAKLDLSSFPAEVLSEVEADPESLVYELVFVAAPAAAAHARPPAAGTTLAERLQARTEELTAAAAAAQARIASLEELVAALEQRIDELARRADRATELEQALALAHEQRRHLQLDVAVKDAFIAELRSRVETLEAEAKATQERFDEDKHNANVAIAETRLALVEVQESLAAQTAETECARARAAELDLLHHRLAGKANRILHRVPFVHSALKGAVARLASRRGSAGPEG